MQTDSIQTTTDNVSTRLQNLDNLSMDFSRPEMDSISASNCNTMNSAETNCSNSTMTLASPSDDGGVVRMMMDCSMNQFPPATTTNSLIEPSTNASQIDSGIPTASSIANWPPTTPSPFSTAYEYAPFRNGQQQQQQQPQQQPMQTNLTNCQPNIPEPTPPVCLPVVKDDQQLDHQQHQHRHHNHQQRQSIYDGLPPSSVSTYNPQATIQSSQSFAHNGTCAIHNNNQIIPESPHNEHQHQQQQQIPQQINHDTNVDLDDQSLIGMIEEIMTKSRDNNDDVVLTNSLCLLFRFSIDSVRGHKVCQAMSASSSMMNLLYHIINSDFYQEFTPMLCYATGNLTSLTKIDECREILLRHSGNECFENNNSINMEQQDMQEDRPSPGVESLLRSLRSKDMDRIIFAITGIHNLLLDTRPSIQEQAKQQVKHGVVDILKLLDNQDLAHYDKFKVIVLDCIHILAYRNPEFRLIVKRSNGPRFILQTIERNLDRIGSEELIAPAFTVLKSLSVCPENKIDIINNHGIEILTKCLGLNSLEIMKICLWTLRNLSDVISNIKIQQSKHEPEQFDCILHLIDRLLTILKHYEDEPSIITCILGILHNLTCNNELVKQKICYSNGVELLIRTIGIVLQKTKTFSYLDEEIIVTAINALCHLMNQTDQPALAEEARINILRNMDVFKPLMISTIADSNDLSRALTKFNSLACTSPETIE